MEHPPFPPASVADLLARLEAISRERPDRVLRLTGTLPADPTEPDGTPEPFELLIFRGFSSSVTQPTAFDPDHPALPEQARITAAELLAAPLDPARQVVLREPGPVEPYLHSSAWC